MNTATEAKEKIVTDPAELLERMTRMLSNAALTLMIGPLAIESLVGGVRDSNPERFYNAKSSVRNFILEMEKAIPEFKRVLEKLQ